MIKIENIEVFAEKVRQIGDQLPDKPTEGLGEYLSEARDHDVIERIWYAKGFLDAVKSIRRANVAYTDEVAHAHKRLEELVDGTEDGEGGS